MKKLSAVVALAAALAAGCGSSTTKTASAPGSSSPGATSSATSASTVAAAFCANAKALGSLGKGAQDAMAMSPAESMKDFEALGAKITALRTGAPADLGAAIDTVAARFSLEAKAEEMMAADPNGATSEAKMLADHKADDDAAAAKLIAGVKSACNIDLS